MPKTKKSFTLIEMLIVIVIIGILAAALVPRLQSVQGRARDTKRKVDLRSIYNANEIYLGDQGTYPMVGCTLGGACATRSMAAQPWIPELSGYMTTVPVDPRNIGNNSYNIGANYNYMYGWIFNTPVRTYDLIAQLENTSDTERCGVKNYRYYGDNAIWCAPYGGSYSDQIYDLSPNVKNSYQ